MRKLLNWLLRLAAGLLLLAFLAWAVLAIVARRAGQRAEALWRAQGYTPEYFRGKYPKAVQNASATELIRLAQGLGIRLDPDYRSSRYTPNQKDFHEFQLFSRGNDGKEDIKEYLLYQKYSSNGKIMPLPKAAGEFLAASGQQVEAIIQSINNSALPQWNGNLEVDFFHEHPINSGASDLQSLLAAEAIRRMSKGEGDGALDAISAGNRLISSYEYLPFSVCRRFSAIWHRTHLGLIRLLLADNSLKNASCSEEIKSIIEPKNSALVSDTVAWEALNHLHAVEKMSYLESNWYLDPEGDRVHHLPLLQGLILRNQIYVSVGASTSAMAKNLRLWNEYDLCNMAVNYDKLKSREIQTAKCSLSRQETSPDREILPGARMALETEMTRTLVRWRAGELASLASADQKASLIIPSVVCPSEHWEFFTDSDGSTLLRFSRPIEWPDKLRGPTVPLNFTLNAKSRLSCAN